MSSSADSVKQAISRQQWRQLQDRVFYTSAIRSEKNEIRLMTILPGQEHEDIEVQLNVVSLDDEPQFEALSYVWGDPNITRDIRLNGRGFPITTNLYAALQSLRRTDKTRVFWADAICVNQRNSSERGSQVSLMVRIYRECTLCTVWLGEETETTGSAFEMLEWLVMIEGHISDCPPFVPGHHLHLSSTETQIHTSGELNFPGGIHSGLFVPLKIIF